MSEVRDEEEERWRNRLAGLSLMGAIAFVGIFGTLLVLLVYQGLSWRKYPVTSLAQVERTSRVRFPPGSQLIHGEGRGVYQLKATVAMSRESVNAFVSQPRFQRIEREPTLIRASGSVGFDRVWVEIPNDTDPAPFVRFEWACDD
jgi:hypothetical protein